LQILADQVIAALISYGLPAMRRVLSDEGLRDLYLSGHGGWLSNRQRLDRVIRLVREIGPHERLPELVADNSKPNAACRSRQKNSAAWSRTCCRALGSNDNPVPNTNGSHLRTGPNERHGSGEISSSLNAMRPDDVYGVPGRPKLGSTIATP
jgi:hypothetical protein